MHVTLVGLGSGCPDTLTHATQTALERAQCVLGAPRLLEGLDLSCETVAVTRADGLLKAILDRPETETFVAVFSGDTGFYSGADGLAQRLDRHDIPYTVLPGLSSVQLLAARLGRPWQNWTLRSAHGKTWDLASALETGTPVFFLTGGQGSAPGDLCAQLVIMGLGEHPVTIGENLGRPDEAIHTGQAEDFVRTAFSSLSVVLLEALPSSPRRCPGWPDEAFIRGSVPMTKQEVRAAALAKLAVCPGQIAWDVGAGTGSVSVELALAGAAVYAVECQEEANRLILENQKRFGAWSLHPVPGRAPEILQDLPAPDLVFLGGSKGNLLDIMHCIFSKNPKARVCVSAIALETLQQAMEAFQRHGIEAEITQISVSRAKDVGDLHLLLANNPVFLITGNCP